MSKTLNLDWLRLILGFALGVLICALLLSNGFDRTLLAEPDAEGHGLVEQRTYWLGGLVVASHQRVYDRERQLVETSPRSWQLTVTTRSLGRFLAHLGAIGLLVLLLRRLPARWAPPTGLQALRDRARALWVTWRERATTLGRSLLQGAAAMAVVFILAMTFGPRPIEYQWTLAEPERLARGEQALAEHLEQTGQRGRIERDRASDGRPILRLVDTRYGIGGMLREPGPPSSVHEAMGRSQLSVYWPAPQGLFWLMGLAALLAMRLHWRQSKARNALA